MSNVQVKISNVDVAQVLVQNSSGGLVKALNPGETDWFAVSEGGEVSVQSDSNATKITVSLGYAGPGSPVSMSTASITIDLYSAPVFVQANSSLTLKLQAVYEAAMAGAKDVTAGSQLHGADLGVKCGEIIIYPPA